MEEIKCKVGRPSTKSHKCKNPKCENITKSNKHGMYAGYDFRFMIMD